MIVAGSRSSQLTVFSAEGYPLNAIGGTGDGPGEFRLITSLQGGPDDSLFVFDGGAQRLTVFSGDGRRARTATFRITSGDGLTSVMRLTDGIWVGKEHESIQGGQPYEIVRDTIAIGLLDATLAGFQALEHLPERPDPSRRRMSRVGSRTISVSCPCRTTRRRALVASSRI
jgi:hypothetical protein